VPKMSIVARGWRYKRVAMSQAETSHRMVADKCRGHNKKLRKKISIEKMGWARKKIGWDERGIKITHGLLGPHAWHPS